MCVREFHFYAGRVCLCARACVHASPIQANAAAVAAAEARAQTPEAVAQRAEQYARGCVYTLPAPRCTLISRVFSYIAFCMCFACTIAIAPQLLPACCFCCGHCNCMCFHACIGGVLVHVWCTRVEFESTGNVCGGKSKREKNKNASDTVQRLQSRRRQRRIPIALATPRSLSRRRLSTRSQLL